MVVVGISDLHLEEHETVVAVQRPLYWIPVLVKQVEHLRHNWCGMQVRVTGTVPTPSNTARHLTWYNKWKKIPSANPSYSTPTSGVASDDSSGSIVRGDSH